MALWLAGVAAMSGVLVWRVVLAARQIERAQRKVEAHNFDIRKNLLEYDDVANDQRKVVYVMRNDLMEADEVEESIAAIREEVVEGVVHQHIPPGSLDEMWDEDGLAQALESYDMMWLETETFDPDALRLIRQSTRTPICTGEDIYLKAGFFPFFRSGGVSVIHPDLRTSGGIYENKKIGDLAQVIAITLFENIRGLIH